MFSRTCFLITFGVLLCMNGYCQHFAKKDFDIINAVVDSASTKAVLVKRLNGLLKNYMPSRSGIGAPLNRQLDGEFYHQRIVVRFYPNNFFINLLTRHDSIFFSTVCFTGSAFSEGPGFKEADSAVRAIHYNTAVMATFLKNRNSFYQSEKTLNDLAVELSGNDVYLMNCGAGSRLTVEDKQGNDLLKKEDPFPEIRAMLQNFSCEEQAYGVTAIDMLINKGVSIDNLTSKLYKYIRKRNTTVITCSFCIIGVTKKLYDQQ
ncbi:hypothetical protein [Chitinophaga sp.]|uniref:hypothetical protein n=1 Tax=Chitinophaga sp. TaxID=1869181 RepID=UPI002F92CBBE